MPLTARSISLAQWRKQLLRAWRSLRPARSLKARIAPISESYYLNRAPRDSLGCGRRVFARQVALQECSTAGGILHLVFAVDTKSPIESSALCERWPFTIRQVGLALYLGSHCADDSDACSV